GDASSDVCASDLAGADKVGVNTAAIARPELIREIAERFGNQVLVLSLDVRRSAGPTRGRGGAHSGARGAAGRSPRPAGGAAPGWTRSTGHARWPSSAPARSCSTRWTRTAPRPASTS